mgnify:CR=1 FL=1
MITSEQIDQTGGKLTALLDFMERERVAISILDATLSVLKAAVITAAAGKTNDEDFDNVLKEAGRIVDFRFAELQAHITAGTVSAPAEQLN